MWNANGVLNRKDELVSFLADHHIDVALICETHLKETLAFSVPNYRVHRSDRLDGRGGGTAVLIKNSIPHMRIPRIDFRSLEETSVVVHGATGDLYLTAVYRPARNKIVPKELVALLERGGRPALVAGDLNAKHTAWNSRVCSRQGAVLHSLVMRSNSISIIGPTEPTRIDPTQAGRDDVLDVFVVGNWVGPLPLPVVCSELTSDHLPVTADIHIDVHPTDNYKTSKSYDWDRFRQTLEDTHYQNVPNLLTTDSIDEAADRLEHDIREALLDSEKRSPHIPKIYSLPSDIKNLITLRNRIRKTFQKTRHPTDKQHFNRLNNEIKLLIREHRQHAWDNLVKHAQEHNIWKLPRMMNKARTPIPALDKNIPHNSNAEILADVFEKQFTSAVTPKTQIKLGMEAAANSLAALPDETITTTEKELREHLKTLRNKAPGPDNIPNYALKNLPDSTIRHIVCIFNGCLALCHFPAPWKLAKIVPVLKQGKNRFLANSYRPISLLNTISKIFEKILHSNLLEHIRETGVRNNDQFGFTENHSTVLLLARVANTISTNLHRRHLTGMVSLDLSKAFDSVWHEAFPLKLIAMKFPHKLIKMIQSYLSNRSFQVCSNGITSSRRAVRAGVPQGSALGPVLFTLYINDIPKPTDRRVFNSIYADDTAIIATSRSPELLSQLLQEQTSKITNYYREWGLSVNSEKTEAVTFTNRHTPTPTIRIFGNEITWKSELKYLGVILDSKFTLRNHIKHIRHKAIIRLKLLTPLLKHKDLTPETKLTIYKSYIRPIMTYASPVWLGAAKSNKLALETVQRRAVRMCAGVPEYVSMASIAHIVSIEPLLEHATRLTRGVANKLESHPNPNLSDVLTIKESGRRRILYRSTTQVLLDSLCANLTAYGLPA